MGAKKDNYHNLGVYMGRKPHSLPMGHKIAKFLLKKFSESKNPTGWNHIYANELKEDKICPSVDYINFSKWREDMIRNGFLICQATQDEKNEKESNYKASLFKYGPKIKKYVESELGTTLYERIDSKADNERVEALEEEMLNLKTEVKELSDKVIALVLQANPPDTPKRREIVRENIKSEETYLKLLKEA